MNMNLSWIDALLIGVAFGALVKGWTIFNIAGEQENGTPGWVDAEWEEVG